MDTTMALNGSADNGISWWRCQSDLFPFMRSLSSIFLVAFLTSIIPVFGQPQSAGLRPDDEVGPLTVVSTVWPLHLLATEVLGEDGHSSALIDRNDSAHHFTLTPDDRMEIARADLLVWIDPEFEVQLADLFDSSANEKPVLRATAMAEVNTRTYADGMLDPHLWLEPGNGIAMARALADKLAELAPHKANEFRNRASLLVNALEELQTQIAMLGDLNSKPFFVYHDAFSYFEARAGIEHSATLVDDPESEPSMRALLNLRQQVGNLQPGCVMLEPDASEDLVASVFQDQVPRKVMVDVLGHDIAAAGGGYAALMRHVLTSFEECLQGQ
jgi:zinc transport system substrate-binding protein